MSRGALANNCFTKLRSTCFLHSLTVALALRTTYPVTLGDDLLVNLISRKESAFTGSATASPSKRIEIEIHFRVPGREFRRVCTIGSFGSLVGRIRLVIDTYKPCCWAVHAGLR
jgi:hypothetical protein